MTQGLWNQQFLVTTMLSHGTPVQILTSKWEIKWQLASKLLVNIGFMEVSYIPPTLDLFELAVVSVLTDVKHYTRSSKRNTIKYDKEEGFHYVLSDCRSELAMIQGTLLQQQNILQRFLGGRDQDKLVGDDEYRSSWTCVENARETLNRHYRRTQRIDGDAERIEKSV
jgi:hypothetical protein